LNEQKKKMNQMFINFKMLFKNELSSIWGLAQLKIY